MTGSLHGLRPGNGWVYLRFGEFYALTDGRITDAYVLLDLVDLCRQLGCNPLPPGRGVEGYCPGPAAQDGLLLGPQDPQAGADSLHLVERMIYDGLQAYDQVHHGSIGMERFWTADMMWYGPAGIGATRGLSGFLDLHQYPWQEAFRDYVGGNHVARVGDGLYVASTGWPSITATHTGSNLFGMAATGRKVTMRVMDWWRREGALLDENWIFIDIPDLLRQLGRDLLAEARAMQARGA
jgi:predicted ester cyclase